MLQECMEVFSHKKKELGEDWERWLLEQYVPKDGTYILLNMDKDFTVETKLDIKADKKTGKVEGEDDTAYPFISYLDYYSKLIEMNKPIDSTKIIHSNNMYAFFVKKESFKEKLAQKSLDSYYSVLKNPYKKYTKPNDKLLYQQVEQELGSVDAEILEQIQLWIQKSLSAFLEKEAIDLSQKDYLKLFFIGSDREASKEKVKKEGMRYIKTNLYNKNEYNVRCEDGIKGFPSNNMGLNAKKPYLDNKTRKTKMPYMLDINQAITQMEFFDYLSGQASKGKNDIYVDLEQNEIYSYKNGESMTQIDTGIYLRISPGKKELEIHSVTPIIGYKAALPHSFVMKEVIPISEKSRGYFQSGYGAKTSYQEIEELVDTVFFDKKLKFSYFVKPEEVSINPGAAKKMLLMYREQLWEWFYKGSEQGIGGIIAEIAQELAVDAVGNGEAWRAQHRLNLWISIVDYLNEDRRLEQSMNNAEQQLKQHIDNKEEWDFSSSEEYYYAVGQMANLFFYLSKSSKKSLSMINPILNAKSNEVIRNRILQMFKKYNYAMGNLNDRITRLLAHILKYEPETKVDERMITAGFVSSSVIFMKKED